MITFMIKIVTQDELVKIEIYLLPPTHPTQYKGVMAGGRAGDDQRGVRVKHLGFG